MPYYADVPRAKVAERVQEIESCGERIVQIVTDTSEPGCVDIVSTWVGTQMDLHVNPDGGYIVMETR